jgi:uncharacterized membrane protein YphA (DoxX/SURF4 family)
MTAGALGLVAGLVLCAVFVTAGVGKLTDRPGTRKAVGEFGAPDWLVSPLALLLPAAELAVAVALLFATTRLAGAAGALVLLGMFSAAVGVSLARGQAPDCHCFGQLHSEPASWKTLVRNALLAGLAVALAERGPGALAWVGRRRGPKLPARSVRGCLSSTNCTSCTSCTSKGDLTCCKPADPVHTTF